MNDESMRRAINNARRKLDEEQPEMFPLTKEEKALWQIWDLLHLWNDEEWDSAADFMEAVADIMLRWTGTRFVLPPKQFRNLDDDMYEMEE